MEHHDHSLAGDIDTRLNASAGRRRSLRWLFAGTAALPIAGSGGRAAATTSEAAKGATRTTAPGGSPARPAR